MTSDHFKGRRTNEPHHITCVIEVGQPGAEGGDPSSRYASACRGLTCQASATRPMARSQCRVTCPLVPMNVIRPCGPTGSRGSS